jgi:TRAP-type C4-dicarboxylate transport system permease small subunit
MAREGTPVLGVPFMWVFVPFVLLLLALVVRSVREVAALFRRRTGASE